MKREIIELLVESTADKKRLVDAIMLLWRASNRAAKDRTAAARQARYRERHRNGESNGTSNGGSNGNSNAVTVPPEVSPPLNPPLPSPPPSSRVKPRAPSGDHAVFIEHFTALFEKSHGVKPTWNGKTGKQVSDLLKAHGLEECQRRASLMFERAPAWPFEHADMGSLVAHFDKLTVTAKVTGQQTSMYSRLSRPRE